MVRVAAAVRPADHCKFGLITPITANLIYQSQSDLAYSPKE